MNKQKGIASIAVMGVMLFLAVALPVTTSLVKKNQENRSKAAAGSTCSSDRKSIIGSDGVSHPCSVLRGYVCYFDTEKGYNQCGDSLSTKVKESIASNAGSNAASNSNTSTCESKGGHCDPSAAGVRPGMNCNFSGGASTGIVTGDSCGTSSKYCCIKKTAENPTCSSLGGTCTSANACANYGGSPKAATGCTNGNICCVGGTATKTQVWYCSGGTTCKKSTQYYKDEADWKANGNVSKAFFGTNNTADYCTSHCGATTTTTKPNTTTTKPNTTTTKPNTTTKICTPFIYNCDGNISRLCNPTGTAFLTEKTCADNQICKPVLGCVTKTTTTKPNTTTKICTPGIYNCDGNISRLCNPTGTAFLTEKTCADNQICKPVLGCVTKTTTTKPNTTTKICTPFIYNCDGNISRLCNPTGTAFLTEKTCADNQICKPVLGCVNNPGYKICTPGTISCNGNTSQLCNSIGTALTNLKTCADNQICKPGQGCVTNSSLDIKWKINSNSCDNRTGKYTCSSGNNSSYTFDSEEDCINLNECEKSSFVCVDGENECVSAIQNRNCLNNRWIINNCNSNESCIDGYGVCQSSIICNNGDKECLSPDQAGSCINNQWKTTNCDSNQSCVDGVCQFCNNGDKECVSAGQARSCINKQWKTTNCDSNESCIRGECHEVSFICTNGEKECVGDNQVRSCINNQWKTTNCDSNQSCVGGVCQSNIICNNGEKECVGDNQVRSCINNQWKTTNCDSNQSCVGGVCQSNIICTNGEKECVGDNQVRSCINNQWKTTNCDSNQSCVGGVCQSNIICTNGEKECVGDNQVRSCINNQWKTTNCDSNQSCVDGGVCQSNFVCVDEEKECESSSKTRTCLGNQWIIGDCATGESCIYGVCETTSTDTANVDIKIAFAGVKNGNNQCAINWPVSFRIVDLDGEKVDEFSGIATSSNTTNDKGEIIYNVTGAVKNIPQDGINNSSFFITGPKHLSMKYGKDGQADWFNLLAGSLSLKPGINNYDFSKYSLFAGDVTGDVSGVPDGKINGMDYSFIKEKVENSNKAVDGINVIGDIDGNCQVNSNDVDLLKQSLIEINSQLY